MEQTIAFIDAAERHFWQQVYRAYAGAYNALKPVEAAAWADAAVLARRARTTPALFQLDERKAAAKAYGH